MNDGTIEELLDTAVKKLGYSWSLDNNVVLFTAIVPQMMSHKYDKAIPLNVKKSGLPVLWTLDPKDRMLRNALTKWCDTAHWQLVWNVNADYPIITTWSINGSFEVAINEVLKASQSTNVPLMAIMHDKNRVLEICNATMPK